MGSRSAWEGAILRGKGASHCKVWGHSAVICTKTAESIEMSFGFGLGWAVGIMCQMRVQRCWGALPRQPLFGFRWAITSVVWWLATRCLILGMGFRGQAIRWRHKPISRFYGNHFLAFYIWAAHWRHLANTTEPPVCCGDAASCQITLTTCYSAPQCLHCKRCTSYANSVCLSVCLSVRPSVTRRYCVKTTARSTVQFALSDRKMCLVL